MYSQIFWHGSGDGSKEKYMIIRNINLETVCGITSKLPENTLPEIAFAGKSNVGKSSLINALMNRKFIRKNICNTGKDTDDQLL